ncbi:conserved membrane protein of unknown function [Candidatus Promineifilum breve]|uniref:DUF4956 domain-containing protein n=1 Tax=Candidatus Promineifilum breve TaxID=1806508 RepID=A0A160T5Q5_9CHLR|nr:DUF4956 domain-containing protein [Candidatus Promineifilum breve]CUS04829.2 conserved membrane protein of unknown function [Candidatus Promineifilum breve]
MSTELLYFILGAALNMVVALLIVRFIYYPATQDKTYVFTFLAFNTVIYFVLGMLTSATLSVGVGFGLFAIFSVLRYRTDEMPIREMTYLFIVIALPVMNSVMMSASSIPWLLVANGTIVALLYALEKEWGFHFAGSKRVVYDRVELITPANQDRLLADLRERTGLPVERVEVRRIDFLHDTAELMVYYDEPRAAQATPVQLVKQNA